MVNNVLQPPVPGLRVVHADAQGRGRCLSYYRLHGNIIIITDLKRKAKKPGKHRHREVRDCSWCWNLSSLR